MRRLVLDASVLLAAPVGRPEGSPSLLVEATRSGAVELVACETLLGEFERGLASRYFRDRVTEEERVRSARWCGASPPSSPTLPIPRGFSATRRMTTLSRSPAQPERTRS